MVHANAATGEIFDVVGLFDTVEYTDFWTRITPERRPDLK